MKEQPISCPKCKNGSLIPIGFEESDVHTCTDCSLTREVGPTDHCIEMWNERSLRPEIDVIDAYNNGIRCYDHGFEAERVRYHHPSRIALLMSSLDIITAIYIPTARWDAKVSVVRALVRVEADNQFIADLCNESLIDKDELDRIVNGDGCPERGKGTASGADAPARNHCSRSSAN